MRKELKLPETYSEKLNGSKPLTFSAKSSILNILLGPENASGFTVVNYFHQKLHLKSLRGLICLYMKKLKTIAINMLFLKIAVRKFRTFPRKTFPWNCFFIKNFRLPDTYWECSSGKFMKFSEQFSQKTRANGGFCN